MALLHPFQLWLAAALLCVVAPCMATVYTVGGPAGWTTPSRAKTNYTEWAISTPFKVGDSLEFNYVPKAHTVLEVIRSDFRYCNKTNPIESFNDTNGKTVVVLSKPGNYYFIDGVGQHCEEGQKFQASVAGVASEVATPAQQPSPSPVIPPATSAAMSTYSSMAAAVLVLATMLSALVM